MPPPEQEHNHDADRDAHADARSAIGELHRQWIALERDGRAADTLDLCHDSVVFIPYGGTPITGKAAIRTWIAGQPTIVDSFDVGPPVIELNSDASEAMVSYAVRRRVRADAGGPAEDICASYAWHLRRTRGGDWRVAAAMSVRA